MEYMQASLYICEFLPELAKSLRLRGMDIGRSQKSGGQKIDLIFSLLVNNFSSNFACLYLLPIRTQARIFRIFRLFSKKLLY